MKVTAGKFIAFVLSASLMLGFTATTFSHETSRGVSFPLQQTDQGAVALQEGRRLLTLS